MSTRPSAADCFRAALASMQTGDKASAERHARAALRVEPLHFGALSLLGALLAGAGRYGAAEPLLRQAAKIAPGNPTAFYNHGLALQHLDRPREALVAFDVALSINDRDARIWNARGTIHSELEDYAAAVEDFDRALSVHPSFPEALSNKSFALRCLWRLPEALAALDQALRVDSSLVQAWRGRALILSQLDRLSEALDSIDKAVGLDPKSAVLWSEKADICARRGELAAARAAYGRARDLDKSLPEVSDQIAALAMRRCDWTHYELDCAGLRAALRRRAPIAPFLAMAISCSARDQQANAVAYLKAIAPPAKTPLWRGERYAHDRIRLAYLSADFNTHATSFLMAGVFERHDRSQFETIALSLARSDATPLRRRIEAAFERFVDLSTESDANIARFIRELEVDILVDINALIDIGRPQIAAQRPAPIQVNYLGYPGTMAASYIDYLIADHTIISREQRSNYAERIAFLPYTYHPTDDRRTEAEAPPTRAAVGLPDEGFVFCCFNNNFKVTPEMFDHWARILAAVPGSVLWLLQDTAEASAHLRREAEARSLDPARLVFAPRVRHAQHLARHALAGLFLDTLPVNAHTTASDCLWVGVPLLTVAGETFAGRVAASLLKAVGLPELIAPTLAEYEQMAIELARNAERLRTLREKLAANRLTTPLFDTAKFSRHLEAAFATMHDRRQRGLPPADFDVPE